MKNNFVYRNYLLPEFPKVAHQLRTYLQSLDKYRDYSLEEINLVIKNVKEDKLVLKKLKKQMKQQNNSIQELRRKYFQKYLLPIQGSKTYEESIYEIAKAQSINKSPNMKINSPEFIKTIYQQIKFVHPSLKKLVATRIEQTNKRLCKKKQYLRCRFIAPLAFFDPRELLSAEQNVPNVQILTQQILNRGFLAEQIRHFLSKTSYNQNIQNLQWNKIGKINRKAYEQQFRKLVDRYNSQIDIVCLKNQIEKRKLFKMISNQFTNGIKIEQEFKNIREGKHSEKQSNKEDDLEGTESQDDKTEQLRFYSSDESQLREDIEESFTDDQ